MMGDLAEDLAGRLAPDSPKDRAALRERFREGSAVAGERLEQYWQWVLDNPQPMGPDMTDEDIALWMEASDKARRDILGQRPPEVDCDTCKDRRFLRNSCGDVLPCPDCSGTDPVMRSLKAAGIPPARMRCTFDSYSVEKAPMMAKAFAAARSYADNQSPPWLALMGNQGVGKTHLAYAIAHQAASAGVFVRFWRVASLLDAMRQVYEKTDPMLTAPERIQELGYSPELLILDDLGAEKQTDWVIEKLFDLFDERYAHAKPLLITSQLPIEELDSRVARRLKDREICRIVACTGPDFGQNMKPRE